MTLKFARHTSASPEDVLEALRQSSREWGESVVPADLGREGVLQLETSIRGRDFTLGFVQRWYQREVGETLQLRGRVTGQNAGGSVVVAEVGRARARLLGAAVSAAVGLWLMATGSRSGAFLLGFAVIISIPGVLRNQMNGGAAEDQYLVLRLEEALTAAEAVAAGRRAQSV